VLRLLSVNLAKFFESVLLHSSALCLGVCGLAADRLAFTDHLLSFVSRALAALRLETLPSSSTFTSYLSIAIVNNGHVPYKEYSIG
jgi:hypothetical protein